MFAYTNLAKLLNKNTKIKLVCLGACKICLVLSLFYLLGFNGRVSNGVSGAESPLLDYTDIPVLDEAL